ncbi:MAG: hypothetical protein AB7S75_25440 [Desulfococcaceae bacterium]
MIQLHVTTDKDNIIPIIQSAIEAKIRRTEIGLRKTEQEIRKFETRYRVLSERFLAEYAAEDLEGGDDDYVSWMGEIQLRQSLVEELQALREIEYVPQRITQH